MLGDKGYVNNKIQISREAQFPRAQLDKIRKKKQKKLKKLTAQPPSPVERRWVTVTKIFL